jgi:hypothetical protein
VAKRTNNDLQNIHAKNNDRVTGVPLKTGGELRCSGRVSSYCSTICTRHVSLVANLGISHEWGKDREVFTTSGTYLWSFVTYSITVNQVVVTVKLSKVMTSTCPRGTLGSVASLLIAAIFYQGNSDRNHKLWNILSTERYILHMQVLMECCYIPV